MKNMLKLAVAVLVLGVAGCTQNPSKMGSSEARKIADKLTYTRDKDTHLCYAAVASRGTGDMHQNGFSITWVPCSPRVLALIGK